MNSKPALQFDQGRIVRMCVNNDAKALRNELAENPECIHNSQLISAAIKHNAQDVLMVLLTHQADIFGRSGEHLNNAAAAELETLKICNKEMQSRYESKQNIAYARGVAMLSSAAEHNRPDNVMYLLSEGYGKANPAHLVKPLLEACKKGANKIVDILTAEKGVLATDLQFNAAAAQGHLAVMHILFENNGKLKINRETAKVISNKREAAIGTGQYSHWADLDDTFNQKTSRPVFR